MKALCLTLVMAFAVAVTFVQCQIADECQAKGGTPVRGAVKAVECIPGYK